MRAYVVTFTEFNFSSGRGSAVRKKAIIVAKNYTKMKEILQDRVEKLLNILFVEDTPTDKEYFREIA